MNKTHATILATLISLVGVAPCLANDADQSQVIAMMGTQPAPVVVDDTAIQKAIDTLIKQQKNQSNEIKKNLPKLDNPVGEHPLRNTEKVMILGGADAFPM